MNTESKYDVVIIEISTRRIVSIQGTDRPLENDGVSEVNPAGNKPNNARDRAARVTSRLDGRIHRSAIVATGKFRKNDLLAVEDAVS